MTSSSHSSDSQRSGVATTQVSFVCQRCCQPLKLDQSFSSLDSQTLTDLTAPLVAGTGSSGKATPLLQSTDSSEPFDVNKDDGVSRKVIAPARLSSHDSGQDFTLLGETASSRMESLSHRLKVSSHLFDIMSGQSDIDHPLCEECTDSLLDQLDQQLKITEDECKHYRESLERLTEAEESGEGSEDVERELLKLKEEEAAMVQQLELIERERKETQEEKRMQLKELEELKEEEENYWQEYNEYKRQLLELQEDQRSVDNQLRYTQTQLERLKKTNVFNATFHIWHNGHFGTINGFRLGRLPSVPVEWSEINAAWGQTVLLLHSLAQKMNFTFQRFRLVPYGNHSHLESLTDKSKQLPLHGSGGFRFFWDTKFDHAMVAFLDCLQQLEEEVERGDSSFCLPYKMANGKLEDTSTGQTYSIKIQFNSEEQWTKALKFMLTNLKWALAWVSSQFNK
ncbi:beclin-1-like [Diadema antillarum]|uniref:beclin-1-like n=1 Tax=Diadema antillarum TaxID=105358 RepID=UPI003A8BDDC3